MIKMTQENSTDQIFFLFNLLLDHLYHPASLITNKNEKLELSGSGRDLFLISLIGFLNGLKTNEGDDVTGFCTMKHISRFLRISGGASTSRIDQLVDQNLVVRSMGKKDRRQIILNLTKKGEEIYEKLKSGRTSHIKWILSHLNEEETQVFLKIIEKFSKLALDHFKI